MYGFKTSITAFCVTFLIKLRWPKTKSLYDIVDVHMYPVSTCTAERIVSAIENALTKYHDRREID